MELKYIVLKTGDLVGHLIAAGLGIGAINNAINGNYDIAATEGIISVGIEASKYLYREKQNILNNIERRLFQVGEILEHTAEKSGLAIQDMQRGGE